MIIANRQTDDRVLIVAEIGNNHEGDAALAEQLVGLAADAGADAVKFQTFVPEHYVTSRDTERLARLRRFALRPETVAHLRDAANRLGLVFFSTPFDLTSVGTLEPLVPVYKVASGDITFTPLLERIAVTGKPIILSTGAATLAEIERAVACIRRVWDRQGTRADLAILHCVAAYPVPPEQVNLLAITTLRARFPDCTIGYSDHVLGNDAAVAAVALGSRIVEKHFTIAHDYSEFRDHQLSATPEEFRSLVQRIRGVEAMLGNGEKVPQACEESARTGARRSIAAARDLPAGTALTAADLTWVRPAGGIPPGEEATVLGHRLRLAVAAGIVLDPAVVEPTAVVQAMA